MNAITSVKNIVSGLRMLAVPRAEDLPYWTSPPIQFVYESITPVVAGIYAWNDAPSPLTVTRPLLANALYYFRSFTLSADTEELDFTSNILTSPQFFMFLDSDAKAVLFREPILMNKFYDKFDYRLFWMSQRTNDQLFAAFVGSLFQGAGLIGKSNITLKAIISAQEIVDERYIELFRKNYPVVAGGGVE